MGAKKTAKSSKASSKKSSPAKKSGPAKKSAGHPMEGKKAPTFELSDSDGTRVALSQLIGKKNLVLYFYPRDMTPGCTIEACSFRDNIDAIRRLGAQVVGVSGDSPESHRKVHRQACAQLHVTRGCRQRDRQTLRRVQDEVSVRAAVHGNRAEHVRDRSRGRGAQGVPEGQGERPYGGSDRGA